MTQTTYTPTLMEKLLGKNYKWWYILKFSLISETGGLVGFLWEYFAYALRSVVIIYIWFLAGSSSHVFTYLLIGNLFDIMFNNVYYYRISGQIFTGKINNQLLFSVNFFSQEYFRSLGARLFKNLILSGGSLIAILISLTFVKIELPNLQFLSLIPVLGLISFSIQQFAGIILGSMAFWFQNEYRFEGLSNSYSTVVGLLAGALIPLDKLPFNIGNYIELLPFSYLLHHPMQIYLGNYSFNQTLQVFAGGLAWCLVLYFLAKSVFKMGLKRNESVGL